MFKRKDYLAIDLGSQVLKGVLFSLLANRQVRLRSYAEEDLGPGEIDFTAQTLERYRESLEHLLKSLAARPGEVILALPVHHLTFLENRLTYRRKVASEPVTDQELKNLFFYAQSRFLERVKKQDESLLFVGGALSRLCLDERESKIVGRRGRELEVGVINSFAPTYLVSFARALLPGVADQALSFFVPALGLRGGEKHLLVIDSGAAKISFVEIDQDLIRSVKILPLGGLDLTCALAHGRKLERAEEDKKKGFLPKDDTFPELLARGLNLVKRTDESTAALLAGRSWHPLIDEEVRHRLTGTVLTERELNRELGLIEELPVALSAAARFSLFEEEESPQRLFQRIANLVSTK